MENELEHDIQKKLKSTISHWKKMDYSRRVAMLYLYTRFVPEYSVVFQVLSEIKKKDADFIPKNVFDFGSGLGTVMWATNSLWKNKVNEYLNCDSSREMNALADLLTKGGSVDKQIAFKSVKYKLNFPKTHYEEFDLVTSCFSLFELNNRQARLEMIEDLWNKVNDEGYLVLVESGTKHGFKLISEARTLFLTVTFIKLY